MKNIRTKKCPDCKEAKPLSEFYKAERGSLGVACFCKKCQSARCKKYYSTHKGRYKINSRKHYLKHRVRILRRTKRYTKNHPRWSWMIAAVSQHKRHGLTIINETELKKYLLNLANKTHKCYLCGNTLDWSVFRKKNRQNSPSLDRIDNENELRIDNVQIICTRCNVTKQDRTLREFIEYCRRVVTVTRHNTY